MRLPELEPRARWGVCVLDAGGAVLLAHREHEVHRTASIGKLLLLVEVARGLADGTLRRDEPLDRRAVEPVADSGLWQHLDVDVLPLHDVALLVASVSDNLATNVLVERLGLPPARGRTALHDVVRDHRGPQHPRTLSTGTAAELAQLMTELPAQVRDWLRTGTDLSMVAAAFGLDPLAHTADDLLNKTGTDSTVRADVGLVGGLSYAVLAEWDPGLDLRAQVLAGMRRIGEQIRGTLPGC
jgi:beta-lactamase class A